MSFVPWESRVVGDLDYLVAGWPGIMPSSTNLKVSAWGSFLESESKATHSRSGLMAPMTWLDNLSNALVSSEQLSRLQDGQSPYWTEDAQSIRFVQGELTQAAGVLLRLPQEVVAKALVVLQRLWISFDDYEEDKVSCST